MNTARRTDVLSEIRHTVESMLKMTSGQLDVDARFDTFGVDSIAAMQLISRLSKTYQITLTPAQFTSLSTVRELAEHISEELGTVRVEPVVAPVSRDESFDGLLQIIKQKYSVDLTRRRFATTEEIVEVLVDEHFDVLTRHFDLAAELRGSQAIAAPVAGTDVAVVGMSCRFADAPGLREFWNNLMQGKCSIREIPTSRWEWRSHYSESIEPQRTISRWGALLEDIDCFDAGFFAIPPRDATLMDPQERLLFQEVYRALQDAGIKVSNLAGSNTGVFVGYEYAEHEQYLRKHRGVFEGAPYYGSSSSAYYLAHRLSYSFDLRGPSEAINVNCASSAVQINRAYYSLLDGESDLAVAAGVSLNLFVDDYIAESQYGLLSPDGTCAVFDDRANGYTRGEGVGVVVLKRLADAERDHDTIYGIIKSCHQNNRGRASSLSAIRHELLTDVLKECYRKAAIAPESVRYIEVDGYCTKWGDSFEFEGLRNVFDAPSPRKHCALGSLKGNIGHLEPASGIASFIKVALSLHHGVFPPTITGKVVSEFIDIENSAHPLYIAAEPIPFRDLRQNSPTPVRAGVNSFSDSGCNVHILLEEYTASRPKSTGASPVTGLCILSAKDRLQLQESVRQLDVFLSSPDCTQPLENILYTLQVGREEMGERLALTVSSRDELLEKLQWVAVTGLNEPRLLEQQGIYCHGAGPGHSNSLAGLVSDEVIQSLIDQGNKSGQWKPLASVWVNGGRVPWERVWADKSPRRASLPGYPFAKERYWLYTETVGSATATVVPTPESLSHEIPLAQQVESLLQRELARVLKKSAAEIALDRNYLELGLDSLGITSLVRKINRLLEVRLSPSVAFKYPDIRQLSEYLAQQCAPRLSRLPPLEADDNHHELAIQPVDREGMDSIPLSYAQERLWFINQLEPGSSGYNVPGAVRIRGELDIGQLEQAFAQVIARHENLRTVFPSEEGRARQRILEQLEFKLRRVEMDRHESVEERRRQAREYCQQEASRAFDLAQGPLIRGHVLRIQEQEHILMLNLHHIISDGWSIGVLVKELGQIMRGQRDGEGVQLAPLPIQYVDYSLWQRKRLEEGGLLEQQLQYWQEKLAGVPESVDLAHDYPRPAVQSFAGATRSFSVDAPLTGQLKRLSEEHGCTLYMTLLAVFKVLLYRYTGQEDLCVGSPIANRQYAETEGLIGMFVNTLVLRSQVRAPESFAELLGQVRQTCLEAYEHQDAPFEKVVERVRPQRNMAISPLFQVMVVLQNLDMGEADELIEVYGLDSGISKFDLSVEFTETAQGLAGAIEYSTGLYRGRTIEQMVGHFLGLCRAVIASPGIPIGQLQYLQEPQRRRVVQEFNATQAPYPSERCIHQLFAEQVALDGERPAVRYGDEVLSYRQLWDRSRELGVYLQSLGVGPDSLVGLCVERSLEMVVGLLGILQAGGAYVPLDPDYPPERLGYMLRDTGARVVLTQSGLRERLSGMLDARTRVIELDRQWEGVAGVELREEVRSHHLAYVIYTSGSTGTPKGVQIEHRSLVNHNSAARKLYGITAEDVQVQFSSMGFDLFLEEVFVVLNSGAELVLESKEHLLTPQYFSRLIAERKITTLNVPTAFFHQMVASELQLEGIRTVIVGGERLESERVREFQRRYPQVALYNTYGPTETTIISTATRVSGELLERHGSVSIGRPIDNTQIYILDAQLNPQPVGVPGELYIAGAGLARGYLNRPELTQERFVSNPFTPGERMYRSGDRARWLEDGHIEYLGRVDTQVKIRGFRIETGEIEARLNQHPQIRESVVVAQDQESGKRLVAFYCAHQSEVGRLITLAREEIRSHLSEVLPAYMVPETYVSVAGIPLTAHGKVDRLGLERMEVEVESGKEYLAPRTEMERQLVEIWGQVLGLKPHKIGVHDSFFELGGHSLLATQLIYKIRSQLKIDLPVRVLFEQTTVARLVESIAVAQESKVPPIQPVDREGMDSIPLSYAQERLWFINQLEPESSGYNVPGAVRIRGELDIEQLEQAFAQVIARHENLRTVFPSEEGRARQRILEQLEFKLRRVEMDRHESVEERRRQAREYCQQEASRAFDLAQGPLIRGHVLRIQEQEHILMLNLHHIISDGWSIGVLVKELGQIMRGQRDGEGVQLAPLPIQYVDYSLWQRKRLEEGGLLEQQLQYWQEKLAGVPESVDLAHDYPRPAVQSFAGATRSFSVDAPLTGQLKRLSEEHGCTLYMTLLAVFKVLLYRYTGQEDLCVGSPIANRQYAETEGLIGMFVNTLVLRSQVRAPESFAELLGQVRQTCLEAYEHQDAPFEKVVERVRPQRNMAISPLFQVMVVLQNLDMGEADELIEVYGLDSGISKFDLSVEFTETAQGLAGAIEYSTGLYRGRTIEQMVGHFLGLCRAVIASPGIPIGQLQYLQEPQRRRVVQEFNATQAPYPSERCIHQLFAEQVALDGERPAVRYGDEVLSYRQLWDRSRELGVYLQSLGVGPDSLVGLCVERSLEMVVGLLGILQAGGAYVPLDPDYPPERLGYMLRDTGARVVLTQSGLKERLSGMLDARTRVIELDRQWAEVRESAGRLRAAGVELREEVRSHHLAYVIYTSGSTGAPKGVQIEHKALMNRIHWMQKTYPLDANDVVLQKTPYSFDVSVWEFVWPLMSGASLVLAVPNGHMDVQYLQTLIESAGVTTLHYVPSMLHVFLSEARAACGSVKWLFCSGEALDRKSVDRYREKFPNAQLHNLYGPTEAAIDVTACDCSKLDAASVPIGRPIDNTQIYILDAQLNPQPVGVPGELFIAGVGLARGYLNRPELTQERFVSNPFTPGERMYRSGDRARWLEDGHIEYLGRVDTQVKIRGFRIETGEIEARLNQHPQIRESVVVAQGTESGKRLVAFYRVKEPEAGRLAVIAQEELRNHLQKSLPHYMVPAAFVSVATIPLTSNGKVDRRALEGVDVTLESRREYLAPRNETERQLVQIWAQVLSLKPEKIGVHDSFFELGGHSLLATQLMSKIRTQLGIELPLKTLFHTNTLSGLAEAVEVVRVQQESLLPDEEELEEISL